MVMEVVYSAGCTKLMQFMRVRCGPWKVLNLSRSVDWIYMSYKKGNGVEMKHELIFMPHNCRRVALRVVKEICGQIKMVKTLVALEERSCDVYELTQYSILRANKWNRMLLCQQGL